MRSASRLTPGYGPSECLVHFVRASRADNSNAWFERLYKILLARVLRALPSANSADGKTISLTKERIRDKVSERIVEMLAGNPEFTRPLDVAEAVWRAATDDAAPTRVPAGADAVTWSKQA